LGAKSAPKADVSVFVLVLSAGVETCRLASIFSDAAIKSLSEVML
jgi:hypothetical protein